VVFTTRVCGLHPQEPIQFTNPAFIGKFSAAIAALTLAFSRGSGSDANTDDILMIVLGQLSPGKLWDKLR
jgi:hypothetical protein